MKSFKKGFSILLILIMTLSLFSGCKKEEANTKLNDGKITVGIPGTATLPDVNTNALSLWLEEVTGLDITWVEFAAGAANYKQQITLMCAGNETLPEVMVGFDGMGHYAVNQFGEDGFFQDLSGLIAAGKFPNYTKALEKLDEKTRNYVLEKGTNTVDGKSFYSLPSVGFVGFDTAENIVQINKKWLERVGMDIPTTIQELEAVCKAFMEQDANGNGDPKDEIPMLDVANNPEIRGYILNAFVEYNSANFNVDEDGKVWDPIMTDELRQGLKCVNDFTNKGYYNQYGFTLSQTEVKNLISPVDGTASRVGIFGGHPETSTNSSSNILEEFVVLPPLKDETGKGGYYIVNDPFVQFDGYITKDCYDLDEAARFLDVWYLDECVARQRWGVKGEHWVYEDGFSYDGVSPVHIKVLDSTIFFDSSKNATLGNILGILTVENYQPIIDTPENTTDNRKIQAARLAGEHDANLRGDYKRQVDTLENLVYTMEEYDYREGKSGICESYVSEQLVLFMKGERDINSDKEWKAFQDQVKKLERGKMMEIAQAAYNRRAESLKK